MHTQTGRHGIPHASPTSPWYLQHSIERGDGAAGGLGLWRREEVTGTDRPHVALQPRSSPLPLPLRLASSLTGDLNHHAILLGDCVRHPTRQLAFMPSARRLRQPDRRGAARIHDLIGKPLELFTGPRIQRERHQVVQNLNNPQTTKLAPQRNPGSRRLTRQPIRQEHPLQPLSHDNTLMQPRLHCRLILTDRVTTSNPWVVREGTTNIVRHSSATSAGLSLGTAGMSLRNDGAPGTTRERSGLRGLAERLATVGATLDTVASGDEFVLEVHWEDA